MSRPALPPPAPRAGPRWAGLVLALVSAAVVLPFVPLVLWALSGEWRYPDLLPTRWSTRGLEALARPGLRLGEAVQGSLVIAAATAVCSVAVGLPAGVALGARWRGKGAVLLFVLLPVMVPPLVSVLGLHLTLVRLGLADTWPGVLLAHLVPTASYSVLIVTAAVAARDRGLDEVARTLGASPWATFWQVTWPDVRPSVVVAGLFSFLISWGQYVLTLLVGGGSVLTLPMLLFSAASGSDPVLTGALALVFAVPPLLVLVVSLRLLGGPGGDPRTGLEVARPS